jgi:hypothetical protein
MDAARAAPPVMVFDAELQTSPSLRPDDALLSAMSGYKRLRCIGRPGGAHDPGCVKTLRGIIAPGILGSMVMRRAKKRKNLSPGNTPVVLLSGGIGATPVLAILHALAA